MPLRGYRSTMPRARCRFLGVTVPVCAPVTVFVSVFVSVAVLAVSVTPGEAAIDPPRLPTGAPTSGPRTLTVAATGEILVESPVKQAAAAAAAPGVRYEFAPLFAPLAPILARVDLAICHMEFPIGAPGEEAGNHGPGPYQGFRWLAPYELAAGARAAGYTRCSTASNHSYDLGDSGVVSTLDALDAAGVGHAGTARSPEETDVVPFDVNGVKVAHMAYSRVSNTVVAHPWQLAVASVDRVVADVAAARAQGAEVVILSLHVGPELLPEPASGDRAFVEQVTAATHVDLVVMHGPHVVQPVEWVNGSLVYWSVGNQLTGMGVAGKGKYVDPRTLDSLMAVVRFTERPDGSFVATPWTVLVCLDPDSRVSYPAMATLSQGGISDDLRARLQRCVDRSSKVVADLR